MENAIMTMSDYQRLARRTQNPNLTPEQRLEHASWGLAAEVGEVLGHFQKTRQGHELDVMQVALELGDMFWFASELCDRLGLSLEDVARANIEKLRRRYPEGFDAERSLHREG